MESPEFLLQATQSAAAQRRLARLDAESEEFYQTLPELRSLISSVDRLRDVDLVTIRPIISEFFSSGAIERIVQHELVQSSKSVLRRAQTRTYDDSCLKGFVPVVHPAFQIVIAAVDPIDRPRSKQSSRPIVMPTSDTLVHFLRAGGATISFYECERLSDTRPPSPDLSCWRISQNKIEDGHWATLEAGSSTFVVDYADAVICVCQTLLTQKKATVAPRFCGRTLQLESISACDDKSSRVQLMATVLRAFDDQSALDALTDLTHHPDYFVRWHVIREILAMDQSRGIACTKSALRDSHPHVRATAQATLDLLNQSD